MRFLTLTNDSQHFTQDLKDGGILLTWNINFDLSNVAFIGVHSAYLYPFTVAPKIEQIIALCTSLIDRGPCNPFGEVNYLIIKPKSEIAVTQLDRGEPGYFHH